MKVSEICVGCGQCAAYCAQDAITVLGRASMTDRCIGCTLCVKYCPVSAISVDK